MIKKFLENYKVGTFVSIVTERSARVKKVALDMNIVKRSKIVARLGINYDNISQTKMNRTIGNAPKENQGLVWGKWEQFPYIIEHKGTKYLRMYANKGQIQNEWFINGKQVSKDSLSNYLLSSETKPQTEDSIFTLSMKFDNIKSIG